MRTILYICPTSSIGGAETFIKQTWDHGNLKAFRNIYLLFDQGPLEMELLKRGATVERLSFKPRLSKIHLVLKVKKTIERLIDEYQVDLVHSTMAYSALFAAWACHRKKCPHIWFQHGPASGWMDQLAATFPHQGLITNSQYTFEKQKQLEKKVQLFIAKGRKQLVLHLGVEYKEPSALVDEEFKQQLHDKYHLQNDEVILSILCRIQHWKGVHLLIEAIKLLKQSSLDKKFSLIVWGEAFKGQTYLEELTRECDKHQLPVIFAGPTTEPLKALAASHLLINASIQPEPFGFSIIEAMSVGTPVLAANEGGPSEIIKHGVNGLLFETRNANSLAQQLELFISDKKLAEKLSRAGIDSIKNQFNVEKSIAGLQQYYLDFL